MIRSVIVSLLLIPGLAGGQEFPLTAGLPQVPRDGFYRLLLTPELSVYLNGDFSNIRISDSKGQDVPYIREAEKRKTEAILKEYALLERITIQDSITRLVFNNPQKTVIENISVLIRNAKVTKHANLTGSDNGKDWYVLNDHITISDIRNPRNVNEIKIVDFPLSNYQFYALTIDDSKSAPLYIIKAGYYFLKQEDAEYFSVPVDKVTQYDSARQKRSFVRIAFDTARFVERVSWQVSGPPFYRRNAALYEKKESVSRKGVRTEYLDIVTDVELRSGTSNTVNFSGRKAKDLLLVIENDDNPPLQVEACRFYQLNRHLTAWLKKDDTYQVRIGDANVGEPVYDLPFFKDSIPQGIPVIANGPVVASGKTLAEDIPELFTNKSLIWGAIILVIVLLGFMSVKMVRETNAVGKP